MKKNPSNTPFIPIKQAIDEIRQGHFLILLDDENRENEGDFVIAADKITPEAIGSLWRVMAAV